MKKIFAVILAVTMLASMATVASAAETTTLTTSVPAATYTLNIPADQEIPFGATSTNIGNVTVTNSSGFAEGKNLAVTVNYDAFSADGITTQIPYTLSLHVDAAGGYLAAVENVPNGSAITFLGKSDGTVNEAVRMVAKYNTGSGNTYKNAEYICVNANSDDWGKALAGEYTATITFTAEVVVG